MTPKHRIHFIGKQKSLFPSIRSSDPDYDFVKHFRLNKKVILLFLTFLLLQLSIQSSLAADINVSGTITTDTTWTTGNTYIATGGVTVNSGITLTIEPNVIVKFNAGTGIGVSGTLDAQSTSGNLIYFTAISDDTVGGDTNGDGDATTAVPGSWTGISINNGGSANLTYMEMRYSGAIKFIYKSSWTYCSIKKTGNTGSITTDNFTLQNTSSNGMFIYNSTAAHSFTDSTFNAIASNSFFLENVASITVQNSTIQNSGGRGIYLINSSGTLSGNTIQNNSRYGVYITGSPYPSTFTNNSLSNNTSGNLYLDGNTSGMDIDATNTINAIIVGGTLTADATWQSSFPYQVNGFTVSSGATLTISAGRIVKFNGSSINVSGTLDAQGNAGNLIYFTDIRDDTVGGDSNGDGGSTTPAPGGWGGIIINDGGSANLTYMEMRYSGAIKFIYKSSWTYCSIKKTGNSGSITTDNFTLKNTSSNGMFIYDSTAAHSFASSTFNAIASNSFFLENVASITVQNSTIQNSGGRGIYLINSSGTLSGNTIQNNSQYGVYITGSPYPSTFTNNSLSNNTSGNLYLDGNTSGMDINATNTINAIIVGGTLTADATWQSSFPYQVNGFTVGSGATLTISAGQIVKFNGSSIKVSGTLEAQGTSGNLIYFTDIRDDTVGGDSNSDGGSTTPAPGGWGGIIINDGGSANLIYMEMRYSGAIKFIYKSSWTYCSIKKTGNSGSITTDNFTLQNTSSNGMFIYNSTAAHSFADSTFNAIASNSFFLENVASITIQNSTIQNSGGRGIYLINSSGTLSGNTIQNNSTHGISTSGALSTPVIKNNIIKNNPTGIYANSSANPAIGGSTLNGNDIYGNTAYGVYNADSNVTVTATHNWWGDASGPYQATTNPTATGNPVSNHVDYDNYTTLPINESIPIIKVTPTNHDYNSVAIGLTAIQTFTIHNSGNTSLHINSIAFTGTDHADFSSTNDNCTGQDVASTDDCTFDLEFRPLTLGGKTATGTINSSDPNTSNKDISLQGTGSNPVLSITKTGTGDGTVTSNLAGIDCGDDCSEVYAKDTSVILSAAPQVGTVFNGWSGGGCTGSEDCIVEMNQSFTITATFVHDGTERELTVATDGTGFGTVTSTPPGINCGNDCNETYLTHTPVELLATAIPDCTFTGWSGGGCSGTENCLLIMDLDESTTATFDLAPFALMIFKTGKGTGAILSDISGIDCGNDCSETFTEDDIITLTATPDKGAKFNGWSGACTGVNTCVITMNQAKTVTADFGISIHWALFLPAIITNSRK